MIFFLKIQRKTNTEKRSKNLYKKKNREEKGKGSTVKQKGPPALYTPAMTAMLLVQIFRKGWPSPRSERRGMVAHVGATCMLKKIEEGNRARL